MNVAPWSNTAAAPSLLNKRPEAIPEVLKALDIDCDIHHVQAFINNDWMGDIIIQSEVGGWSRSSWKYHPQMQMSYWADQDLVVWSQANEHVLAPGRVIRMKCGNETVHLAHWPVCNNISRVYPHTETLPDMPLIEHPLPWLWGEQPLPPIIEEKPPHTVPEPGTFLLVGLGIFLILLINRFRKIK